MLILWSFGDFPFWVSIDLADFFFCFADLAFCIFVVFCRVISEIFTGFLLSSCFFRYYFVFLYFFKIYKGVWIGSQSGWLFWVILSSGFQSKQRFMTKATIFCSFPPLFCVFRVFGICCSHRPLFWVFIVSCARFVDFG